MVYVDGFVLVVKKKQLAAYTALAKKAGKVWREHGALEYRECVGDDLATPCGLPFEKLAGAKRGEHVVFAWIVYRNKAHRDRVNRKVMADSRFAKMCTGAMPFDMARMSHGGFRAMVDL